MEDESHLDRLNDGMIDGCRGREPRSQDADYLEGYKIGCHDRRVVVVMPTKPEGYYHAPVGTFD